MITSQLSTILEVEVQRLIMFNSIKTQRTETEYQCPKLRCLDTCIYCIQYIDDYEV